MNFFIFLLHYFLFVCHLSISVVGIVKKNLKAENGI